MSLSGPSRKPASGGAPKQLVLFLHGWGANGANLIELAGLMAGELPDAQFFSPDAPHVCEVNPEGFQWFSLLDRNPQHMLAGARAAAEVLDGTIAALLAEFKLDASKLALVGFSQGTMTALHAALRRADPVACVVGFSGALIGPETLAAEIKSRPPVCLIHGDMDDVVPFAAMSAAAAALEAHRIPYETHTRPRIGHSIDMKGVEIATGFLKRFLLR